MPNANVSVGWQRYVLYRMLWHIPSIIPESTRSIFDKLMSFRPETPEFTRLTCIVYSRRRLLTTKVGYTPGIAAHFLVVVVVVVVVVLNDEF